jgi:aspartyl-tRNA(Asn)/glutamyl-tRNA(Gln) amidotransferase subunit B
MNAAWEMVIGLEVHVHLKTQTKIFCRCATTFGSAPNENTCPVCTGLPGALPVLNAHAVELAMRAALAMGCRVHPVSVFERKNYFYPDLPKGYQISQLERPLATAGEIAFQLNADAPVRRIGITRIHMEEDAGKLVHDRFVGSTAVDLNRAGVPLIEIVSDPDMRAAAEARRYVESLKEILEYTETSGANMEEGSLRVDANVSIRRPGERALGTRTEIKNMNSLSGLERAIDVEFARQCALVHRGEQVVQQTLLWDEVNQTVRATRSKEESPDYRYFPDPDLPPLVLSTAQIEAQASMLPELPAARRERLIKQYALTPTDAAVLASERVLADYFEGVAERHGDARAAATWVMGEVSARLKARSEAIQAYPVAVVTLAALLDAVRDGALSRNAARTVLEALESTGAEDPRAVAADLGLTQERNDDTLLRWVDDAWEGNPEEVTRLVQGESKLLGVLVGLVMKSSGGRADPKRINELLRSRVDAARRPSQPG